MADATVDCRKWQPPEAKMADPTTYEPGYDFTATDKGAEINAELDNIAASVQSLAAAVAGVRRSDGQLQNQIVTMDALDAVSLAALSSEIAADLADQLEVALAEADVTAAASAGSASAAAIWYGAPRREYRPDLGAAFRGWSFVGFNPAESRAGHSQASEEEV